MTSLRVGQAVEVHDPLGYSGHGEIREIQTRPHEAVLVLMHSITDRTDQSKVGEEVWVLTGHVTPINDCDHCKNEPPVGHTCPRCGRKG